MSLGSRITKKNRVIRYLAEQLAEQKNSSDGIENGLNYTADELIKEAYGRTKNA